mgnify:CR=1 FL=1
MYNVIVHNKEKDGKHEKNKKMWKKEKANKHTCFIIYII